MRKCHGVGRDDRQTRRHRLHGRDALQLRDGRHHENCRSRERVAQVGLVDVAGELHVGRDAERRGERLELGLLVTATDDLELRLERRVELRERADELVDLLLVHDATEEDDEVVGSRLQVGRVVVSINSARDREHVLD